MTTRGGIDVAVRDGFAIIDFVDPALRGPALAKLVEIGGGASIESFTRGTPRKVYRVPEGNAREAGLLTDATTVDALQPAADTGFAAALADAGHQQPHTLAGQRQPEPGDYPDGEPSEHWKRPELDAYAAAHGIDTTDLPSKAAALAAINERTNP
ncbi:hypothetical protein MKUB_55860 [Mycobacterium kubicae]|uniref:Uncharacterized protein n=1 Tax=Mycobacterium kubicae TaxID=120959 RepID=A0AAX1J3N4_9MYCO|nr:hypothetical protein [Mycobacterium kubicae]MCV7094097.1 hypothetical protein [Mycobacterium kubicae]ORV98443.1 hypothetical protein AWC13_13395 [Mycobacterium kubicae]QNI12539.1 hypothetical protein GAN18_16140 [Mycobacterium kubicae]QPI36064.1 hypothetical protein I2456_15935 [Mycobacterium kubicae]GFG68096.1 hypothetical protein MKUB_55860 [Mycobacterium kubicae]